jgi:DNA-binding CsgD family transcriptional regulator
MEFVERGLSNAEIAKKFGVATRTLEMHLARLMQLLEVNRRSDLIAVWKARQEPSHPERIRLPEMER